MAGFTCLGLVMGATLVGFEGGLVPGDRRGVAGAWGDDAFFRDSKLAGGLLG